MARFEDSKTILHDSIKFRKHTFVTSWKDYIRIDMMGERTILKKDLSFINENNHRELVKLKLAERKQIKFAKDDDRKKDDRRVLPPVPSVPLPMAETREETQKKLLLAELEGPIKLEADCIRYKYFEDRARKERAIETSFERSKVGVPKKERSKEGYQRPAEQIL